MTDFNPMNVDQVIDLGKEVSRALAEVAAVAQERDMLRRVLKQAVLTHGGELRIDTSLADEAKNDKRMLEIGGGGVRMSASTRVEANNNTYDESYKPKAKTKYTVVLTNGETDSRTSGVSDFTVGIQGVTWQGELRLVGMSRTKKDADATAARLSAGGMDNVKVLDLSRE